jgi:hypothetical protein
MSTLSCAGVSVHGCAPPDAVRAARMARQPDHLPAAPASLDSEHAAELSAQVDAALKRQRRELTDALERALEHIPRPLRGAVRRVMGL